MVASSNDLLLQLQLRVCVILKPLDTCSCGGLDIAYMWVDLLGGTIK